MGTVDKRIDTYIMKSADFAIPILEFLRETVHEGCPEVKETMKWSMPHFDYNGSILCSMASFKGHCSFGFWLGSKLKDPDGILEQKDRSAMGHLGRITSYKDLPSRKKLLGFIKQAMKLIDEGVRLEKKLPGKGEKKALVVPPALAAALKKNPAAATSFKEFTPGKKKEYINWIIGAKTEATRAKRIATAVLWIAEGKSMNWKYERR